MRNVGYITHFHIHQVTVENVVALAALEEETQCEVLPRKVIGDAIYKVRIRVADDNTVGIGDGRIIIEIAILYFAYHFLSFGANGGIGVGHHFSQIVIKAIFYIAKYGTDGATVALQEHLVGLIPQAGSELVGFQTADLVLVERDVGINVPLQRCVLQQVEFT